MKSKLNLKKYSRKNNKKFKCIRKMMRGGVKGQIEPRISVKNKGTQNPTQNSRHNTRKNLFLRLQVNNNNSNTNEIQENKPSTNDEIPENNELQELNNSQGEWEIVGDKLKSLKFNYECEKMFKYKNPITIGTNTYNKYKCFPIKRTNSVIKEPSTIYEDIQSGKTFKVYENTNQSIGIEYNENKVFKQKGIILQITPLELNVDTMQLAINTNSLYVSNPDEKGNVYIGFINNFPSLNVKVSNASFKYSSRLHAEWISVYEDDTTLLKEGQNFNLIKTTDGQYIDENTFNDANITISMSQQQTGQQLLKKDPIEPNVQYTNEGLFKSRINKLRELLDNREISPDVKQDEQLKLENQIKYRANVKIDNDDGTTSENIIGENIGWVAKNALWVEQYLKLKNAKLKEEYLNKEYGLKVQANNITGMKEINNSLKGDMSLFNEWKKSINIYDEQYNIGLPNIEPLNRKEYECDLSGLDEKYIIVDEFVNKVENGGDGETYVICGYPEQKMKDHILNFWQNSKFLMFDSINIDKSIDFINLFNLYKNLLLIELIKKMMHLMK